MLNSLWNRDKHRLLLFTKIRFEEFGLTYRWPDGREREYLTRRPTTIEDRADLKRMRHPPGYNADVEVKPHARFGFYFEKAGLASKEPVLELLRKLLTFSNYVLN
ncbi:MAG: hypothetical protein ACREXY_21045 [Gammaproteobacteria bacterium]